jgi:formate-dependent nitrite reductase membrane component NrfD
VCIIIGGLVMLVSLLPLINIDISKWSAVLLVFEIIAFIFALGTAIYTGILIQSVKYVSFWNTWLLPALFTVSALSTGAVALVVTTGIYDFIFHSAGYSSHMTHVLLNIEPFLLLIEAVVLILYMYRGYGAEGQGRNSVRMLLSGRLRYVFWLGIVVSGFVLPVILEAIHSWVTDSVVILFTMGGFSLLGGLFIRFGVIYAGIKDQTPLHKFVEMQYFLRVPGRGAETLFQREFGQEEESG